MVIKEYEWWKSWGWSCRQERIALIEWYLGFYCFTVGMLCDDRLYISSFISGAVHIFKSLEIQSSMSQLPETACAIFPPHIHVMWEFTGYGLQEETGLPILSFYFMLIWKWMGLAALFGHSRSLTAACVGGKLAFSSFPPKWEEENRQMQLYRRSHRR